jgi:hypothetical protein
LSDKNIPYQVDQSVTEGMEKVRKPYRKPQVYELGDLRTLTLGGSPGIGDSGTGDPEFPPGVHGRSLPYGYSLYNPDGSLRDPNDTLTTP